MIELRELRCAVALAEHHNFARAAAALGITQPTLSRTIQSLERTLGVQLFDRSQRETVPTDFGDLVIDHARRLLLASHDLDRDLRLAKGLELGELTVGVGPWAGLVMAGPAAGRLMKQHPGLRLRLRVGLWQELPSRLRSREIDLILGEVRIVRDQADIDHLPFAPHVVYPLCRRDHPLTRVAALTPAEVFSYPVVGPHLPPGIADTFLARAGLAASSQDEGMPFAVTCDSSATLKVVLEQSDAVALMPPFMTADEIRRGTLVLLPVDLGLTAALGAGWLRGRTLSGPARAFLDLLSRHDRELIEQEEELVSTSQ